MPQKRCSLPQFPSLIQCCLLSNSTCSKEALHKHLLKGSVALPSWIYWNGSQSDYFWSPNPVGIWRGLSFWSFLHFLAFSLKFLCSTFSPLSLCDTILFLVFLMLFCCCCLLGFLFRLLLKCFSECDLTRCSCSTPVCMSCRVVPGQAASASTGNVRNAISWDPLIEWETSGKFNTHLWFKKPHTQSKLGIEGSFLNLKKVRAKLQVYVTENPLANIRFNAGTLEALALSLGIRQLFPTIPTTKQHFTEGLS